MADAIADGTVGGVIPEDRHPRRIGLTFLLVGFGLGVWFVVQWAHGEPLRVRPLMLFGAASVLLGIQFILMGLLGEMIAHQSARDEYPVRRRFNLEQP